MPERDFSDFVPTPIRPSRKRFGFVVLENDHGVEDELTTMLAGAAGLHISRSRSYDGVDRQEALTNISRSADLLLPEGTLTGIGYACTSGSYFLGADDVCRAIGFGRCHTRVCSVSDSLCEAVTEMGIKRIGLLTPYDWDLSVRLADCISSTGVLVGDIGFLNCGSDECIAAIEPETINLIAEKMLRSESIQALFIACNALRAVKTIAPLEAATGKTVLTATQVLVWNLQRHVNKTPKIQEFGRLLHQSY